jgi:transposase
MKEYTRFIGVDQHKDSLSVAVAYAGREKEEFLGRIPNDPEVIARWIRQRALRWGGLKNTLWCYEAGPCGYGLYRQLREMNIACQVVAPGLTPKKPTERVKTDRRDAGKLARLLRAGELTPIWVPDEEHEALRDLVRAREVARDDLARHRQRVKKFLLRQDVRCPKGIRAWTKRYEMWLDTVKFSRAAHQEAWVEYRQAVREGEGRLARLGKAVEEAVQTSRWRPVVEALQCLRGFKIVTAATVVVELGERALYCEPDQLMSYSGLVPGENSSGERTWRGGITKAGNAHVRRVLVEAAWHYRHPPVVGRALELRQRGQPAEVLEISWRAQRRLNARYRKLLARGKDKNKVAVAVARELMAFVWEIMQVVEPMSASV